MFANRFVLPWYKSVVIQELLEDPHDLLANLGQKVVPFILTNKGYLVINLLLLGLAKMAGAIGIIYKKDWGVDLLIGLTVLMFPFQVVNLIRHFSAFGFIYLMMGLLIALYLINFDPKKYAEKLFYKKPKEN
jgi:uncharacterized membrane protein